MKWEELENLIKFERALLEEKSSKFEQLELKMQEIEQRHQKEIKLMQNEFNRMRDEENNKNNFSKIASGEHLNTFTHRKLVQGESIFKHNKSNATPMSINYNNISQV